MDINSLLITIVTTIAPAAIMGVYMYWRDYLQPEPPRVLLITGFAGLVLGFLTYLTIWQLGLPIIYDVNVTAVSYLALLHVAEAIGLGYVVMMVSLLLLVVLNRYFDEQVDGIVYSSFLALGFILCQNAIYLLPHAQTLFDADVLRALFLIPIYFFCAILSGYYVSRLYFRRPRWTWVLAYDLACFILIPFACHLILTTLLLASEVNLKTIFGLVVFVGLIGVCFIAMNFAAQRIESHLARDARRMKEEAERAEQTEQTEQKEQTVQTEQTEQSEQSEQTNQKKQ